MVAIGSEDDRGLKVSEILNRFKCLGISGDIPLYILDPVPVESHFREATRLASGLGKHSDQIKSLHEKTP